MGRLTESIDHNNAVMVRVYLLHHVSTYLNEKCVDFEMMPLDAALKNPIHFNLYGLSSRMYDEVIEPELKRIGARYHLSLRDEIYKSEIRVFYR